MSTNNVLQVLEQVQSSARSGANPETRVVAEAAIPMNKVIRQGDVYLRRHPLNSPLLAKATKEQGTKQLAPGTSPGSRHVVTEKYAGVKVMARDNASPLEGPILVAPNGFYLEHPKHADIDCSAPGVYEVTFPRDYAQEEIARRRD